MIVFNKKNISQLERIQKLKLINSICGIRGVHLIGTKSENENTNLAIFSSVSHLGSNPPLLSFISRPSDKIKRDTITNIKKTNFYTINSVDTSFFINAHQTSGKYDSNISEFQSCGLYEEYLDNFYAPFVKESQVKIGMRFVNSIFIKENKTELVIGEIIFIKMNSNIIEENFRESVSIIGLNSYYKHDKIQELDYVRIEK